MTPAVRYLHSVLEEDLERWLAVGWSDTGARDHKPSVAQPIAIIEWLTDESPARP